MSPKERPILFSGPMVRAILEGRKTQTRRVMKPHQVPSDEHFDGRFPDMRYSAIVQNHPRWGFCAFGATEEACAKELVEYGGCPYGRPGDRLWVRETWQTFETPDNRKGAAYRALCLDDHLDYFYQDGSGVERIKITKWRPSIHMPRWASRITLEITGVRVERLQQISEEDAWAEGVQPLDGEPDAPDHDGSYRASFAHLWDSIAKSGSDWAANPWVWVIEFKRTEVTHA